jgi:hypothetical protein
MEFKTACLSCQEKNRGNADFCWHGYLRWVARTIDRQAGTDPVSSDAFAQAAASYQPKHLYFLSDGTEVTEAVRASQIEIIVEPPERPAVRLTFQLDNPAAVVGALPAPFQAFLLEPTVFARLGKAVECSISVPEALGEVISAVGDNVEVARILSAVPELDGELAPDGCGTATLVIPPLSLVPKLPERVLVAVVLGSEMLDDLGPTEKTIFLNDPLRPPSLIRQLHELGSLFYPMAGGASIGEQIVASIVGGEGELAWPSGNFVPSDKTAKLHGFGPGAFLVHSGVVRFENGSVVVSAGRYPADNAWSFFCLEDSANTMGTKDCEVFALRGKAPPAKSPSPYDLVEHGHVLAALERARQEFWSGPRLDGLRLLVLGRMKLLLKAAAEEARERKTLGDQMNLLESFELAGNDLIAGAIHEVSARLPR